MLIIESITEAMKGNDFWLNPASEKAWIVNEAVQRGYIRRPSTTQVEWTEEGLAKARRELEEICGTCGSIKRMSESPCCMPNFDRDEEARQIAKERYSVVKGLWIEPNAKVQTTSDGKRGVLCWIQVDE